MKLKIFSISKTEKGSVNLPSQFEEAVRHDLIKRAVMSLQSNSRQKYGTYERAGLEHHAKLSRRRRDYKGSYGHGISRVPRKILSRSGAHFNWEGAIVPNTVGGRRAHPPKVEKAWEKKINRKENRKAIRSALSATLTNNLVEERGHKLPEGYPFIIESKIESIKNTKELMNTIKKLGFGEEVERSKKRIRAGRGKLRGRKYKKTKGMLIVSSRKCELQKAASNITGVEVVDVKSLNTENLAPGSLPGRMTLFTDSAIEILEKEQLFTDNKKPTEAKAEMKTEKKKEVKTEKKESKNKKSDKSKENPDKK